jgi:hypothetical protein
MAFKQSSAVAAGHQNTLTPGGPELVRARFGQPVAVADVAGTRGVIGILPAGTVPAVLYVRADALGTGFKASVGIADSTGAFSADAQDGGGKWITDDTTGVAGGYVQVVPAAFAKVQPVDYDRKILLEVGAAATTGGLFALDVVYANA